MLIIPAISAIFTGMEKKQKNIKSRGLVFSYDPRIQELFFVSGEKFCFNGAQKTFEIDQDPLGEGSLTPVTQLSFDKNSLSFDTVQDGVAYHYAISSKFSADAVLYDFLREDHFSGHNMTNDDQNVVFIEFEKQQLKQLKLIKVEQGISVDFLTLYFDPGENFLIKYPQQRKVLNSLTFDDNKLVCRTPGEELVWELQVQPVILSVVKQLIMTAAH